MIAELEQDGPPRDRRVASAGRRRGRRTRRAAVVAALALGAALLVPPASAESPARTVTSVGRSVTAADTGGAALALTQRSVRPAGHAAVDHRVTVAKAKKKKGFFAKLGIFLLVVLILVVLFVVVLIALAIRLARRAFGRRRT
ncbi:hypothetical protein QZH56_00125 [Streptomyces olivoreticuli]|uniref:hypothetical protein n=1 Tax=Streptomyces olivoreticuli TaxID=68246 RepID=UPI0026591E38|nr:hypothetical protein [Streptomyces olivoreticuli]WKK24164.1 hypothetical protein QZH56_00125 [Streptomyces olivoreticuli]